MHANWKVGDWQVDLEQGWIARRRLLGKRLVYPGRRLIKVLATLVRHAHQSGDPVSADTLLREAWAGRVVSADSVTSAIYQLRKLFADDPDRPAYIRFEPRRGYRLVADLQPIQTRDPFAIRKRLFGTAAAFSLLIALAVVAGVQRAQPGRAVIVEPLQDVSESALPEALTVAIESTLLSELIARNPGRIATTALTSVGRDAEMLKLQSALVACDRGPALVVRLLDPRAETYLWSKAYSLNDVDSRPTGHTLVQQVANDVSAAVVQH